MQDWSQFLLSSASRDCSSDSLRNTFGVFDPVHVPHSRDCSSDSLRNTFGVFDPVHVPHSLTNFCPLSPCPSLVYLSLSRLAKCCSRLWPGTWAQFLPCSFLPIQKHSQDSNLPLYLHVLSFCFSAIIILINQEPLHSSPSSSLSLINGQSIRVFISWRFQEFIERIELVKSSTCFWAIVGTSKWRKK